MKAVVSTSDNQYTQQILQTEPCFSPRTPPHNIPSINLSEALHDNLSTAYDSFALHEGQCLPSYSNMRLPFNALLFSSTASSIVDHLLHPLYRHEFSGKGDGDIHRSNEQEEEDMHAIEDFHKSCSSNLCFFLGALFYFLMDWLDVYDVLLFPNKGFNISEAKVVAFGNKTVVIYIEEEGSNTTTTDYYQTNNEYSTPKYTAETLVQGPLVTVSLYMCFYILATLCFLMNAIIDFRWARKLSTDLKPHRETINSEFPPISIELSQLQLPQEHSCRQKFKARECETAAKESKSNNRLTCTINDRRALYPRRETSVTEKLAILFGCAAVIDFIGALCYDSAPHMSNNAYIVSVHLYAAAAFLSIFGKDNASGCLSTSSVTTTTKIYAQLPSAEVIGDVLFLVGSIIDVAMSYFYSLPRIEKSPSFVACSCFASALWLLDSVVYIISTARTRRRIYENVVDEEGTFLNDFGHAPCLSTIPFQSDKKPQSLS